MARGTSPKSAPRETVPAGKRWYGSAKDLATVEIIKRKTGASKGTIRERAFAIGLEILTADPSRIYAPAGQ